MRTIELLFLGQTESFHVLLVASDKNIFVLGICLLHLPVEGRGCEHGFDRLERSAVIKSVCNLQDRVNNRKYELCCFWVDKVDDTDPDEVQCSEQEVCSTLLVD